MTSAFLNTRFLIICQKNVEVGNDQTLEGYLSSDFEVQMCCKSSDKTLGSKMAGNLLNE